jgi:hypothetical protein
VIGLKYLAYGSNMLRARLQRRISSARDLQTVSVPGYVVRYRKLSLDGSAKCDLVPAGESSTAHGVLFDIEPEQQAILDRFEGVGGGYHPAFVTAQVDGRPLEVLTYLADDSHLVEGSCPTIGTAIWSLRARGSMACLTPTLTSSSTSRPCRTRTRRAAAGNARRLSERKGGPVIRLVSWNIAHRQEAWRLLLDCGADVALLQEAVPPPVDVAARVRVDSAPWETAGAGVHRPWRTAVVGLSDRVEVEHLDAASLPDAPYGGLPVSRPGSLAVALVTPRGGEPFYAASLYGVWEKAHDRTGSGWIFADASVHRLISDLSALIGQQQGHRIIAAGDLNIYHGYGEHGSAYWAKRYESVFARMAALGLPFVGPQAPGGRPADPSPPELPEGSANVPTYHTSHQTPATACHQLDFVFASSALAECLKVTALNDPEAAPWGPSDHCRVEIELP